MNKKIGAVIIIIGMIIMITGVRAFGVGGFLNPVHVRPGESVDLAFRLQNMVGEENYVIKARIVGGEEVATIIDQSNEYKLPAMTEGVRANFRVTIPETDEIGKEYLIKIMFLATPEVEEGALSISSEIGDAVLIIVGDETDDLSKVTPPEVVKGIENSLLLIALGLLVIIIAITLAIVYSRKKKPTFPLKKAI